MASNLEYIYRLKDQYSKKLATITKKQIQFTEEYRKSIGKINAASQKHSELVKLNARAYNQSNQSINRVKQSLDILKQSQATYGRQANQQIGKLNAKWAKHNSLVDKARAKQRGMAKGMGLSGLAGGVGAGMFVGDVVRTAVTFEKNMNRIKSVSKGMDMDMMRGKIMEWGISTEFSAIQISGAVAEAAQAGMKQAEILKVMPGNIALAASGQMTLVDAMKLSTDVVNQFDKTVTNMRVADFLAVGAATAESTVTELGDALRNTGRSAFMAGLDLKDTSMAIMALGKVGYRGGIGGTFLMNLFAQMKKMTPSRSGGFRKFLSGTGKSLKDFYSMKTGRFTNFQSFLDIVANSKPEKLKALTDVFDIRVIKALESLSGLDAPTLDKYRQALDDVDNKALEMQKTLMEGLPGGVMLFNSAMETSKLVMISSFVKPLSEVMRGFAQFLVYLSQSHSWVLKVTFVIISLTAAITAMGIAAWVTTGALGGYKAMWMLLTTEAFRAATSIKAVTAAQWLFNTAAYANPYVLIAMGIAAIGAQAGIAAYQTQKLAAEIDKVQSQSNQEIADAGKTMEVSNKVRLLGMLRNMGYGGNPDTDTTPAAAVSTMSKAAAGGRAMATQQNVNVVGNIGVRAEQGTEVTQNMIEYNTGNNLQMAY